jgi:hypothetical protein
LPIALNTSIFFAHYTNQPILATAPLRVNSHFGETYAKRKGNHDAELR